MTEIDLTGRTAIVTGGGRGLGRAMTLALVEAGARVAAVMHIAEDMEPLRAECAAIAGEGAVLPLLEDVRDPAACERAVAATREAFGGLDVLVNNAGVGLLLISDRFTTDPPRFWDGTPDAWDQIVTTNFLGAYHMARAAVPHLIDRGWGRIVNVTTSLTTMQRKGYSPYGPSKAALEAATSAWAGDLDGTGVTCNVLVPGGAADTRFLPGEPGSPERVVAGRPLVDPAVMRAPIVWLASTHADGVTGRRFIGKDWDPDLPPERGAENAMGPAGFGPRPEDFMP